MTIAKTLIALDKAATEAESGKTRAYIEVAKVIAKTCLDARKGFFERSKQVLDLIEQANSGEGEE